MWDVSGAGAALQEGFQPGGLLGRCWRGVTLGMAPLIPHLNLYSALHLGELLGLAIVAGGRSMGLVGVWGCGRDPPPSPGKRRTRFVRAQLGCRQDRAALWLWAPHLLGTSLVSGSPRVLLVMQPWGEVPGT